MQTKVIIIGSNEQQNLSVAKDIIAKNDELNIGELLTNDPFYDKANDNYIQYIETTDILLSFKNNAFFCVKTIDNISYGLSNDSFYNNDIFAFDYELFNNISMNTLTNQDILIVWIDTKQYTDFKLKKKDMHEVKYIEEKLNKFPSLYYLDDDKEHIVDDVLNYLFADIDGRYKIIDENN